MVASLKKNKLNLPEGLHEKLNFVFFSIFLSHSIYFNH